MIVDDSLQEAAFAREGVFPNRCCPMSIRVALHHKTEYLYDRPVQFSPHIVRLRPTPHCRTPIVSYSLKVEPGDQFLNWQQDPYSNYLARFVFLKPARVLKVEVDVVAEMVSINPFDFFLDQDASDFPFGYEVRLAKELAPFLEVSDPSPTLAVIAEKERRSKIRTIDYLVHLNQLVQDMVKYVIRMEPGIQPCEKTLTVKKGSCRDSAWLLVQLLRRLGIAARFVSGYLIQLKPDIAAIEGPSGSERDFTDLHAWTEAFLPGAGWVGLDPTSGLLAGEGHIPLACTADPQDAAPISGSFTWEKTPGTEEELGNDFRFEMSIKRIHEEPRVTKPYDDEQWRRIEELGKAVDRDLDLHDVRLTMGGEPTFVSIDDKDGEEWNTAALGPKKRSFGDQLLRRLHRRFAPGGFLHHGQGKWYPGESLPRWAFALYWRKDGQPIWSHDELFAKEDRIYGHTDKDAERFVSALAERLGVEPKHASPGFEDAWYYMWREQKLPANLDPLDNKLEVKEERARMIRIFDEGLKTIVGYALPLRQIEIDGATVWQSGEWKLRRGQLFLIPGDSPMGYRLPLDSLPWEPVEERDAIHERDPWATRGPLPGYRDPAKIKPQFPGCTNRPAANGTEKLIRTALCVEAREGRLRIFMPPVETIEGYLELVSAIEATAHELQMPLQLEGYTPPFDPRIQVLKVTPDPGVIEVNIHPSASWQELNFNTTALYEEARLTRLCTEKFQLDGRHTGTCGGNHVIVGGPTPADSPVLRRPDLLRSLLSYWHNHPSLSYLFSGLFVGPTSQAPRIDEARNDSLYELEIAFNQLPEHGTPPPWLVDRLFRHLLTDLTGNTHRAEFCIDKLYSPDSSTGRLGLVEFRGFEMPPHSRMSLVQQLLLRSLVARFWVRPYRANLVRWGTELHDRFMLPYFIEQDFRDVLDELRQEGYPFDERWFAAFHEFRFPKIGELNRFGVRMELRQAVEPWHVLGEEGQPGGTARYVDSSVERLQVLVKGMVDGRHIVACNGRRVPLSSTGTNGEYVAGVRYRAWQPPSCLHPTIPVHTPLRLDLYDTWTKRAVAGCTYHVKHPGGRSYGTFPVNANEAEGRRISRFFVHGHTPAGYAIPAEEHAAETPLTLDLRRTPTKLVVPAEAVREERASHEPSANGNGRVSTHSMGIS